MMSILLPEMEVLKPRIPKSSLAALSDESKPPVHLNELGSLGEAVEPFTHAILRSGMSAIRLTCTVPTWCPTSDIGIDLHDLHELRSRLLMFIHALLQSLRTSGISASYSLVPSSSPICLVCALPPGADTASVKSSVVDVLQHSHLEEKRESVLLADLEHGPCLVIIP
ncbi:hypothetical protein BDN72DRAFT_807521 [Pluteus cervinus]|uniref:Uncharacterized protein n=1 Tax=Pluteus cervinus TaxID=181527 RepID=A0ACD3BGT6_9AGAR|nr:hypothetical protein BDN72DRAFT_807521 [Pluteus cervinus]